MLGLLIIGAFTLEFKSMLIFFVFVILIMPFDNEAWLSKAKSWKSLAYPPALKDCYYHDY